MSENEKLPVQLSLPFMNGEESLSSAKIFFLKDIREIRGDDPGATNVAPKDIEEKIIESVLERAEQLSWYK